MIILSSKLTKFIKNNIKLFVGIIIGGILFGGATYVIATEIASSNITYTGNGQSTVEGAINDLYGKANSDSFWVKKYKTFVAAPQYYAFGTYKGWCSSTDTDCSSYAKFPTTSTTPPSGKNVYAAQYADGQYGVCIKRNGTEHCFRGRNYTAESKHVQDVYSDISCDVNSYSVACNASDFECYVYSNGGVTCYDRGSSENCNVYTNGYLKCGL